MSDFEQKTQTSNVSLWSLKSGLPNVKAPVLTSVLNALHRAWALGSYALQGSFHISGR